MKVTTERNPGCSAVITVEVDDEQVQRALRAAAAHVSKIRPIPGFRPGKAPYERVERAVGRDMLLDHALEDLAQTIYKQVLVDEKVDPYDVGKLDIVQKEPTIFKFTIPTRPVVKLGDFRSIHMQPDLVQVSDDEINQVVENYRQQQATLTPVTRPAQMGDQLIITVKGGIEGQNQLDREGLQVRIETEEPAFPWVEQLVGMNINETRTVNYTYPADADENFANKTAVYTVTATDLKEVQLPAVDDEFAKSVSSFETLDQFKTVIRTSLQTQKQNDADSRFADAVVDAVAAQAEIDYPPSMLEDEIDSDIKRAQDFAQRFGMTWAKYLELGGKTEQVYRDELKPQAETRLKRLLTLMQVVEDEKLTATSKQVDVEIDQRAMQASRQGERADQIRRSLSTADSRRDIEFNLKVRQAVDLLVASAKGEPTSGKILTPDMVLAEQRAHEQAVTAASAAASQAGVSPSGIITDPSQVRNEGVPNPLGKILLPGQE